MRTPGEEAGTATKASIEQTVLAVVMFEDMQGSTALKRAITKKADEQTFQQLRREHDALMTDAVTRDGAGEIVKWTGDGMIALFSAPSVAVERAMEIQERLHRHPDLKVRIGLDVGEIRIERTGEHRTDVFGAHVDWASRAMGLVDGGHVAVTGAVHGDAFSWIGKSRITWKRHGLYRLKAGDSPLEIYEPYNANHQRPMRQLRGERATEPAPPTKRDRARAVEPTSPDMAGDLKKVGTDNLQIIRPWEAVARDGRVFAERGAGTMYWFKVPLGGLSYPEGFRNFLQPALDNERITKIRFVLDGSNPSVGQIWRHVTLPMAKAWAEAASVSVKGEDEDDRGRLVFGDSPSRQLGWVFVDLSREFTPCFKLFVDDPDSDVTVESSAQIFLSTAQRLIRLPDGSHQTIRIPDAVLRVNAGPHEALLHALNAVANQWDSLFW
ncbi:MAG TPA: adenylate/guanylate cyclase domain-containing protein [Actinomycetota bacterium]|nr:adenylate/guanylate cyclase domain-containing protein [Actinomycetota bacterium]